MEKIEKKFLKNMRFWVQKGFLVKVLVCKEKISTLDKKLVEKRFLSRRVLDKKVFWDKKLTFNFISLFF